MTKIITLFALLPLSLAAQETYDVEVGGSLFDADNLPYYEPMDLVINVGDIVRWTNDGGTHNVNGSTFLFPDNPDGFGSGEPSDDDWVYSHTFTQTGVWDYHCTQTFEDQAHSTTQFGTITVLDGTGIRPTGTNKAIQVFPNPAANEVVLSLKGCTGVNSVEVLAADGRLMATHSVKDNTANVLGVAGLPTGQYFMMMDRGRRKVMVPFVKQ